MNLDKVTTITINGKKCIALVRKLTEVECGRLMDVEDADIMKMKSAGIPKTYMYKLFGNSIVVSVLYHIMRKAFIPGQGTQPVVQPTLFDELQYNGLEEYNHEHPLRVFTLCSGYGSQELALERLKRDFPPFDYKIVGWAEYDPETPDKPINEQPAVKAYKALHPEASDLNYGDMTKIDWESTPDFDLLFYSTPCFVAGTMILTEDGFKPIEEIHEGDMVLTHNNRFRMVKATGKKPADVILNVRSMADDIFCTPNHPFYVRRMNRYGHKSIRAFEAPCWKRADELTKNDYLGIAINTKSELPTWGGVLLHRGTHWDAVNKLSDQFEKEDFWYIMGRYVGDGWQRCDKLHKGILIACAPKDKESLCSALGRLGWKYTFTEENTCGKVTIYGKELCEFVSRYGKYAHGKHIDAETMNLPKNLLKAFLAGYVDSDGCFTNTEYRITTASKELAYGVMQIVAKCLNRPSRLYFCKRREKCTIDGREVNQRSTYSVMWHAETRKQDKAFYEDGYVWLPIKEVKQTNRCEFVYNMEVDEDNSYTANGVIVHNCQSISQSGLQHGFTEGSGTRSSIIWNVRDALRIKKPKYACLENVAAMVSKKFLPMFNLWRDEVYSIGYTNFAQLLNSKNYGVPQNRERIFMWSQYDPEHTSTYSFPEPFKLEVKLNDILEEEVDAKYYLDPVRVQQFVAANIEEIEEYARNGKGEITPLPKHLAKWLEEKLQ